jgi:hypothetical protein
MNPLPRPHMLTHIGTEPWEAPFRIQWLKEQRRVSRSMCCVLYNNKLFSGFSLYVRRSCGLISVPRYVSEIYNADLERRESQWHVILARRRASAFPHCNSGGSHRLETFHVYRQAEVALSLCHLVHLTSHH